MRTLLWMMAPLVLSSAFWGCARPCPEPTGVEAGAEKDSAAGDDPAAATEVDEESAATLEGIPDANESHDAADGAKVLRAVGSSLLSPFRPDTPGEPGELDEAPRFRRDQP